MKKEWSAPILEVLEVKMTEAVHGGLPGGIIEDPNTPIPPLS
ncbi:paeninodin family lasso peptide [Peribacillus kribbensis]|nr:paeninodin family lasso peptide [Peribacillus kribbensis]